MARGKKKDADSEQRFCPLEAGGAWAELLHVILGAAAVSVYPPRSVSQHLPAGVSVPLPAPSQGPSRPSLAQPFSESGAWSLLSLPCAATSCGSETLPAEPTLGCLPLASLHLSICAGGPGRPLLSSVCVGPASEDQLSLLCSAGRCSRGSPVPGSLFSRLS